MSCYARACRQVLPCRSEKACERHWHLCAPPTNNAVQKWRCKHCAALWTYHSDGIWYRDPLE